MWPSHAAAKRRRRLSGRAALGVLLIAVPAGLAVAGPWLTRWGWADTDLTAFVRPPSARHWLGTTQTGRDMYALTLRGTRRSLGTGLVVAAVSIGPALLVGAVAGYAGGLPDRFLMLGTDILLVVPALLAAAIVAPALGGGGLALAVLLGGLTWMTTARTVRAVTRSLREREYVSAARHMGVSPPRIIGRHIVPHLASPLIADAALNAGAAVVAEASLSYAGLGARPPDVSLGTLIAEGAPAALVFPWLFAPPVVALALILLGTGLAGDGLRDALDPATSRRRR